MLFVDSAHPCGLYEGTLLGSIALDTDNHLFVVANAVVLGENNDDWE